MLLHFQTKLTQLGTMKVSSEKGSFPLPLHMKMPTGLKKQFWLGHWTINVLLQIHAQATGIHCEEKERKQLPHTLRDSFQSEKGCIDTRTSAAWVPFFCFQIIFACVSLSVDTWSYSRSDEEISRAIRQKPSGTEPHLSGLCVLLY